MYGLRRRYVVPYVNNPRRPTIVHGPTHPRTEVHPQVSSLPPSCVLILRISTSMYIVHPVPSLLHVLFLFRVRDRVKC